ncbi:Nuclear factor of activated T-cells 5 [Dissostichus eleginoides]|uniref:Nuclear factor of activated T-cells 5 n=1 Tax=Dissostichus eleginoides TaxID=100907 RepID=A0AAD9BRU4_DISEL|nr:Nuclear factor of activated T-cells 5 [Dissostichus eleginoides]
MPSDFISLLSSDLDLNSPKSLYSKESVYDLLPKELQLQPSSTQTDPPTMSQQSGGEAGPPPSAAVASDATYSTSSPLASSSLAMGAPSSGSSTSSSDHLKAPQHLHSTGEDGAAEIQGMEGAVSAPSRGANTAAGDIGSAVLSGPGVQQPQNTPSKRRPVLNISPPPEDLFDDSQMSCQEEPSVSAPTGPDSEHSSSMWADDSVSNFSLISSVSYNDNTEVPRKSRKRTPRQRPGPKPAHPEDSMDVFDADSAKAPHFVLSQLGTDKTSPSSLESGTAVKGGSLSTQYPQRSDGKELKILVQPETQHRARYLTEGSRGSVKDRTQQGFPTVKLEGVNEPVVLQVFVANDAGRVKPHGFYQACRVTGRNTTACKEVDIEGTTVIEIPLEPSSDMTLAVDRVGILKLRNADVEARIGLAGSKKKSTRARLAFRVNIPQPDGSVLTLQVTSSPILCTQPAGVPEILKKSLHSCSARGGDEVFIIGKNFLKGTKVIFQENIADDNSWQAEAKIDMDLFHQNHLIVTVPPSHEAQPFTYTPDSADNSEVRTIKTEGPSLVSTCIFDCQIKSLSSEQTDSSAPPSKRKRTHQWKCLAIQLPQMSLSHPLTLLSWCSRHWSSALTLIQVESPFRAQCPYNLKTWSSPRDPQDSVPPESSNSSGGAMSQIATPSQPQQSQVPLFPQDGVTQLERAVRELQAGGNTTFQQVLEAAVAQQQLNSVLYSPTPSADTLQQHVQQPVSLLQQTGELLTIQTSFPTQPPSHTSPPQQLFQSPRPLAETQSSQQQVQAALLQNTLTVLTSGSLSSEQQPTGSTLYLSPNPQPQQQQPQLTFISSMETSNSQPQSGSLFQSIQNHSQPNTVPQSQLSQPEQTGLLLCTTDLSPQAIPPTILFSTQTQGPSQMGSISVGIQLPDPAEPMSFQDQSSSGGGNVSSAENRQQSLFQEQQPMQVGLSSSSPQSSQPVELFLPQTSLSSLQSSIGSQELNNQAPSPGTTIFVVQGSVGVVANPGQQPPEQLFQTTVGGNVAPQGQANLFVFGIQNDSPQLLSSSGPTLAAQGPPQSSSHMQPLLDQPMGQAASTMPPNMHSSLQSTLQAQMQSSLESAMQTNTQTTLQSSLQATIETSLPTPMQTNLQTQSSLQNQLQASISASSNMDKFEDILESLQKQ